MINQKGPIWSKANKLQNISDRYGAMIEKLTDYIWETKIRSLEMEIYVRGAEQKMTRRNWISGKYWASHKKIRKTS